MFFSAKMFNKISLGLLRKFDVSKCKSILQNLKGGKYNHSAFWPLLVGIETYKTGKSWPQQTEEHKEKVERDRQVVLEKIEKYDLVPRGWNEKVGAMIKERIAIPVIRFTAKPDLENIFLRYLQKSCLPFVLFTVILPEKAGLFSYAFYFFFSILASLFFSLFPPIWLLWLDLDLSE